MISMLEQLPAMFQMLIISIVTLIGSYISLKIIQLLFRGLNVKFGKLLTINTEKDIPVKKKSIMEVHKNCPNWDSLTGIFVELTDLIYKKAEVSHKITELKKELDSTKIENSDLLKDQMDYAERKGKTIIGLCQKIYLKELEIKKITSVTKSHSYSIYRLLLTSAVRRDVEVLLRAYFKTTKLLKATDTEYRLEKEEQIKSILQMVTDILNEEYFYDVDITREELYDLNMSIHGKIKDEFEDILGEARKLVKEKYTGYEKELEVCIEKLNLYNERLIAITA